MKIRYSQSLHGVTAGMLRGFFVGWPKAPDSAKLLKILSSSAVIVLAIDDDAERVVGLVNAISDGSFMAFIPLFEVLPEYQGQGIGSELLRRMLEKLRGFYGVDLVCDPEKAPFYERFGMQPLAGMALRRREKL